MLSVRVCEAAGALRLLLVRHIATALYRLHATVMQVNSNHDCCAGHACYVMSAENITQILLPVSTLCTIHAAAALQRLCCRGGGG
jgi:hypothetical protein